MKSTVIYRYALLLFCGVFFVLASCRSNDEDSENMNDAQLNGLWQPYKMTQAAVINGSNYNQTVEYSICEQKTRVIFNNGAGSIKAFADNNGTCEQQPLREFTYDYNADTKMLTVTYAGGDTQSGTVKTITDSDLIYELKGTFDVPGQGNVSGTTTIYARRTKD